MPTHFHVQLQPWIYQHVLCGTKIADSNCWHQLCPNQSANIINWKRNTWENRVKHATPINHIFKTQIQKQLNWILTISMSGNPDITRFFKTSQPIPPAPTTSILLSLIFWWSVDSNTPLTTDAIVLSKRNSFFAI